MSDLRPLVLGLAALFGLPLSLPAAPHDDDPKLLHVMPAYQGTGFRRAWASRPAERARLVEATRRAPGEEPAPSVLAGIASPVNFTSNRVQLLSWLPVSEFAGSIWGNDCWGYTAPSGREYAVMGLSHGTAFVEITQPDDAQLVTILSGPASVWRDMKVFDHYVYAVSEGGDGIQVFDVDLIDSGLVSFLGNVTVGGDTTATHNVAIDEDSGRLYRCGGLENGLRIYDLNADPTTPAFLGSWNDRYVHDAQIAVMDSGPFAGRQIAFACSGFNGGFVDTGLDIIDVTDAANPVNLARIVYPNPVYSHQAWLSDDQSLLYLNDELDENGFQPTTTVVIDVSDLQNPSIANTFTNGNTAVGHNLYVEGTDLYEANYRSGMRVFDLTTSTTAPTEVAWFDTFPADDVATTNGLWSVYPYFPSGIVIGSDRESGLFVWRVGDPPLVFSYPSGLPSLVDPAGASFTVDLTESIPGDLVGGTETLHWHDGLDWQSAPLGSLGGGSYQADLPALACGMDVHFYVSAQTQDGITWTDPDVSAGQTHRVPVAPSESAVQLFDMESDDGWSAGAVDDTALTGLWERGDPNGTAAQPEDDHSALGTDCWFTGQGSIGGSSGENDIDDGKTTLFSATIDATGVTEPHVSYWRWYVNGLNQNVDDALTIDISDDGGANWTHLETVGPVDADLQGVWIQRRFRIADFVTPTSQVQLRFVARDENGLSIVEAAIDDLEILERPCPDCDLDGTSDGQEILAGADDFNADGLPDACQPLRIDTDQVSVGGGGTQSLTLDPGAAFASQAYFLFGSVTGTQPGLFFGPGLILPVNLDIYTQLTFQKPNAPPLSGFFGLIGGAGQAAASWSLPPASDPTLVGAHFDHAFVLFDFGTSAWSFVSNAQPLDLTP